jgi:hypothetical protein
VAALAAHLRRLPGVQDVDVMQHQIRVRGERQVIAQVGAELVRRGTIPVDLDVEVPDLEAALLHLLDADAAPADPRQLSGVNR